MGDFLGVETQGNPSCFAMRRTKTFPLFFFGGGGGREFFLKVTFCFFFLKGFEEKNMVILVIYQFLLVTLFDHLQTLPMGLVDG